MTRATRTLAAGLVLGSSLAAAAPAFAQHAKVITLMVLVDDYASIPANILQQAREDTTRVFQQIEVEIVWLQRGDARLKDHAVLRSVLVVRLLTREMTKRANVSESVLGRAASGSRLATVFYNRIEGLTSRNSKDTSCMLGHVLAHEMGHLLLPPNSHSHMGIMQARLNTQRAAQRALFFTASQAHLIRTNLGGNETARER